VSGRNREQQRGVSPTMVGALVQVVVIAGLVWIWSTGGGDATRTTVDWGFVSLILATPAVLAASFFVGRLLRRRTPPLPSRPGRAFAGTVQLTTLVLLVPTLLLALPLALMSIFVEPMG
jgi:hypothetical protein